MTTTPAPLASTTEFINREHLLFINNQWRKSESGKSFSTFNPATDETISQVAEATVNDVNAAVTAAREAFDNPTSEWRMSRPRDRQNLMLKLADLMERDAQQIAEIESLNNGKSAMIAQAVDVRIGIDVIRYMAG